MLTSDDDTTIAAAGSLDCEVPFRRLAVLASDTASSFDVVMHALDMSPGYEVVVLLQPTSPLRTAADTEAACERFAISGAPACVSVCIAAQSPYWMFELGDNQTLTPLIELPASVTRRQDLPAVYALNGAIYVADTTWLRQSGTFLTRDTAPSAMPAERVIDIETSADIEAPRRTLAKDAHA